MRDPVKDAQIAAAWDAYNIREHGRMRPRLPSGLRDRICGEQNWRCCYCGVRMTGDPPGTAPTAEHVVPRIVGGPDSYENLVACCLRCNNARGSAITAEVIEAVAIWEGWD